MRYANLLLWNYNIQVSIIKSKGNTLCWRARTCLYVKWNEWRVDLRFFSFSPLSRASIGSKETLMHSNWKFFSETKAFKHFPARKYLLRERWQLCVPNIFHPVRNTSTHSSYAIYSHSASIGKTVALQFTQINIEPMMDSDPTLKYYAGCSIGCQLDDLPCGYICNFFLERWPTYAILPLNMQADVVIWINELYTNDGSCRN